MSGAGDEAGGVREKDTSSISRCSLRGVAHSSVSAVESSGGGDAVRSCGSGGGLLLMSSKAASAAATASGNAVEERRLRLRRGAKRGTTLVGLHRSHNPVGSAAGSASAEEGNVILLIAALFFLLSAPSMLSFVAVGSGAPAE